MNISLNSSTIGIASGLLIQAAGIVYFISALASTVSFHEDRLARTEETIEQLSDKITVLSEDLKLLIDNMQTINTEHRMLFDSGSYGDKKYLPGEKRTY
mgnify:CR=1 FL=1